MNQANKELFKPEEDIATYLVFKNSQYAVENYLKGYLFKEGIKPNEDETIDSLYEHYKKINKTDVIFRIMMWNILSFYLAFEDLLNSVLY